MIQFPISKNGVLRGGGHLIHNFELKDLVRFDVHHLNSNLKNSITKVKKNGHLLIWKSSSAKPENF